MYPSDLPERLKKQYNYTAETGHCINAIPECLLTEAMQNGDLKMFCVPLPVKYVMEKGYTYHDDFVIVNVPYDMTFGAQVPESYFEWDELSDNKIIQATKREGFEVGEQSHQHVTYASLILIEIEGNNTIALHVHFTAPTDSEIKEIKQGKIKLRIAEYDRISFILLRPGKLSWMDASIWLGEANKLHPPAQDGYPVVIYFWDANTGILKAKREVKMDPKWSKHYYQSVKAMLTGVSPAELKPRLEQIYSKASTLDLLELSHKEGD